MRKTGLNLCLLCVCAALLLPNFAWAQQAAVPPGSGQVGVAAAVKGRVELSETPGAVGRVVQSGQPIFLGNAITTDASGHLQILLLDETTFTIGPNSSIVIDTFIYDPATSAGKISAQVVKGTFRFVTGKIAKKKPENMEVKLPSGTIGIRGTIAGGSVQEDVAKVVLLGPGPQNDTGDLPGQITVSNTVRGEFHQVLLTRPGFGTQIQGLDGIPTPPAQIPKAELDALTGDLSPAAEPAEEGSSPPSEAASQGESGSDAGPAGRPATAFSASDQAGATRAEGLRSLSNVKGLQDLARGLDRFSRQNAQDKAVQANTLGTLITTREQLRSIQTGIFHYKFNGAVGSFVQTVKTGSPVNIPGVINVRINLNFGTRELGGSINSSNSYVSLDTTANGGNISFNGSFQPPISFAQGTGPAVFNSVSLNTVHTATADLELRNINNVIAGQARLNVVYDDQDPPSTRDIGRTPLPIVMNRENGPAPP
ncbi:MAG: FecR family protein [Candidatus Omnitrophica bacterium]|nr:FecR family protein [Candidatus Omnitrophota bacterium]